MNPSASKTNTFSYLTSTKQKATAERVIPRNSRKTTQVTFMGYKSPFIKPFLNKTKKFTKENKRYRRMSCLIYSKKEKNKRGDTIPTCWTIKGSFSSCFLLIQNTSEGYTYLKQSSGAGMQSWEPFHKSKAGFCYFFFLCRYIQRLEYVKLSSTKDHHTILPMNVASINSRTWSTVMFTSTP